MPNATINAVMTSTFPPIINLMLMSREIAEYTIGFVFSHILNLNSIQVEHERSYVTRNFVLLSTVYKVIKSIYG